MKIDNKILDKIKQTKPLSQSAVQLLRLTGNPNYSMVDVVKIIELDNVLTASILKVANSASVSAKNEVTSVNMAVSLLGERTIVSAALEICSNQFYHKPLEGYEGIKGDLWTHSLFTGIASRELARFAKCPIDPNQAFTAGILHDIGKAIISSFLKGSATEFVSEIEDHEVGSYIEAEEKELGTDHSEVGFELAKHWRLPDIYQEVIHHHHRPGEAPEESRCLIYSVHVGDILAMMNGYGTGADSLLYKLDPGYMEFFSINDSNLPEIISRSENEFEKIHSSLPG